MKKLLFSLGIVSLIPLGSLAASFDRDLTIGSKGDDVVALQQFLYAEGLYTGPITGNFFTLTREGVRKFQLREKIEPAAGYLGPRTRTKINELALGTASPQPVPPTEREKLVQSLLIQIQDLQKKISDLREGVGVVPPPPPTPQLTPAVISLSFTKDPFVSSLGFVTQNSELGARYPYEVVLDWQVSGDISKESVECAPSLKVVLGEKHTTRYYPNPHTTYSCTVTSENTKSEKVMGTVSFTSPSWVGIYGVATTTLPISAISPLSIGAISFFNGTASDILLSQVILNTRDILNSNANRGRQVNFIVRDGTTLQDPILSSTPFTFNSNAPIYESHNNQLHLPYPIIIKAGEEKVASVWLDNFGYVDSGSFTLDLNELSATVPLSPKGTVLFVLTR